MSGNIEDTKTIRFGAVSTPSGLSNELIYAPPTVSPTTSAPPVLVFFGGDVQVGNYCIYFSLTEMLNNIKFTPFLLGDVQFGNKSL